MNSPEELYKTLEKNSDNYLVVNNALSIKDLNACISIAENLQQGLQLDSDGRPYYGQMFEPTDLLGSDHFFSRLDTDKIAKIYGLEHLDAVEWEIAADDQSFDNDFHNDIKYFKQHVTLQWYLLLDDESRKFHISNRFGSFEQQPFGASQKELNTVSNTMLAFKATPTSFHGFRSGKGRRYNIRLRLYEGLRVSSRIHNFDKKNNTCWLIDYTCNHVKDAAENFEGYLARQTYNSLLANNYCNISFFNHKDNLSLLIDKFKKHGFDRCVIVSAGCYIKQSNIDSLFNEYSSNNWLLDFREQSDENITYILPTSENWAAYLYACEYPSSDEKYIKTKSVSLNISKKDENTLTNMSVFTANYVLPYFKQLQVNTLTLDAR